jgi:hypothetical protein
MIEQVPRSRVTVPRQRALILAADPAAVRAPAADLRSAEGAQVRVADLRTGRGLGRCRWDRHRAGCCQGEDEGEGQSHRDQHASRC